jgi:hypothetical protein
MPINSEQEFRDGICCHRLSGVASLEEAMDVVTHAIADCRDRGADRLLIDARGLVDLPMPTLVDRFLMVEEWALAARGVVAVVLVVSPEYIHPKKFGVTVAAELGMRAEVCQSEEEAFAWLVDVVGPPR